MTIAKRKRLLTLVLVAAVPGGSSASLSGSLAAGLVAPIAADAA